MSISKYRSEKTPPDFEVDNLDRQIIAQLLDDGRASYSEMAKSLGVSDGTIHVRMNKLKSSGAVKGTRLLVNAKQLGFSVSAFIGIQLDHANDYPSVLNKIKEIPEITEIYFTTGDYNILVKIMLRSVDLLYSFLVGKLQMIDGVQSTNTQIILNAPIERPLQLI